MSQTVLLWVGLAEDKEERQLGDGNPVLDCTAKDGPTQFLRKAGEPDLTGWDGLRSYLEKPTDSTQVVFLTHVEEVLLENPPILDEVIDCIEASVDDYRWIISLRLKSYLELKRALRASGYEEQKRWLDGCKLTYRTPFGFRSGQDHGSSATTWQLQWAGFHPDALDFVRKNQRDLPDEVPSDYRQLKPGIIRRLANRESPTIFDRIWDDLDDISQQAIIKVIRDRSKHVPPELALLEDFGFYEKDKDGNLIRWFSPLFEAYVYHYKTYGGIFRRMARIREFADGIADLLEKKRKWKPDIFLLRLFVALTVIILVVLISRSMSSFWGLAFISTLGLLFTMATLWPHFLQLRQSLERPQWLLVYLGFLVVGIVFLYLEGRELVLRFATVDQGQIGLALGVIQVMPMFLLLPKILAYLSDLIGRILPPGK